VPCAVGLYAKARTGAIPNFTGIDSAYEPPLDPELRLITIERDPDTLADQLVEELRRRAGFTMVKLVERGVGCRLLEAESAAGGGSLPGHGLSTVLLALDGPASRLAAGLRRGRPPVRARIEAESCCLDLRTVLRGEDETLIDAVEAAVLSLRG